MLIAIDKTARIYRIAINNASIGAELMSDFSYLDRLPKGELIFDFSHLGAPLTQEKREEYWPGGFGYQPTQHLLEVVSSIATYKDQTAICPHKLKAILPDEKSRVGQFLHGMHLRQLLQDLEVEISFAEPTTKERGSDDVTRQNLIHLTWISGSSAGLMKQIRQIRERIENVFSKALDDDFELANCFTCIVSEAVDNLIEYGEGGVIGGLYYPRVGEVEITMVNRCGGFGGNSASEELDALITACEGTTKRAKGGGNGITELSRLTAACFGTLLLRNGCAKLMLLPDGSVISTTEETGLPTPGASITILLQLLPSKSIRRTEAMKRYEEVLKTSLEKYAQWKTILA